MVPINLGVVRGIGMAEIRLRTRCEWFVFLHARQLFEIEKGDLIVKRNFFLTASVFMAILIFGCDESMQMMKPVISEPLEKPAETSEETEIVKSEDQDVLTEEEAYKKAQETMLRLKIRHENLFQEYNVGSGQPPPPDFFAKLDEIAIEEYGFGRVFIDEILVDIYVEENPLPDAVVAVNTGNLVLTYLAITYQFPEEDEQKHLQRFREHVKGRDLEVYIFAE